MKDVVVADPAEDEAVLREAGFTSVLQLDLGFTFRSWAAYA